MNIYSITQTEKLMTVCIPSRKKFLKCVPTCVHSGLKLLVGMRIHSYFLIYTRGFTNFTCTLKKQWSVLFFGSDEFALTSLRALHKQYRKKKLICRLEVVTAYRGKKNSLVKFANDNGIILHHWPLKSMSFNEFHIGVVASFGHLIPFHVINSFELGMINVHASLLPRWRGSAPIIYTLMHGDTETGVSIMKIMPKRFDIGDVIAQRKMNVDLHETQPGLYIKLSKMGSELLMEIMKQLPDILSLGIRQSDQDATYAPKIKSDISFINWEEMTANDVYNLNRALTGLYNLKTNFEGKIVKLFELHQFLDSSKEALLEDCKPGTVIYHKKSDSLIVKCKENTWISIKQIGVPGKAQMSASDFRNGFMGGQKRKSCSFHSMCKK